MTWIKSTWIKSAWIKSAWIKSAWIKSAFRLPCGRRRRFPPFDAVELKVQRAVRPGSSSVDRPSERAAAATDLRALTTTMALARRHTGRSALLSPA